ncbi:UNVERIFIED_CONTAM: hypothetical protein Sradi_4653800 [Sesamum radiatum]|uniref:Uncharacterized protein n=1 Tax=Sesamum radiatum TaxID=300843 RepID=A0AAW2NC68_SESRA
MQLAVAVSSLARTSTSLIKAAALSRPYPSRPPLGDFHHQLLAAEEREAAVIWCLVAGGSKNGRPDVILAVVHYNELGAICDAIIKK